MLVFIPADSNDEHWKSLAKPGPSGLSDRDDLQVQVAHPLHPTHIGSTITRSQASGFPRSHRLYISWTRVLVSVRLDRHTWQTLTDDQD